MKLDLEASIYVPKEHSPLVDEGFLLAFGSGSSSAHHVRDVIILVRDSVLHATSNVNMDGHFQAVNGTFWDEYCGERNETITTTSQPYYSHQQLVAFYAPAFYQSLRTRTEFSGSELNLEGAAFIPPSIASNEPAKIRFFQRGNGAVNISLSSSNGLYPKSATGEVVAKEVSDLHSGNLCRSGAV